MKKLALLPFLLALGLGCSTSKRMVFLPTAPVTSPAVDIKALEARYPGADGVFLERDTVLENVTRHIMDTASWKFFETHSCRYVVLNADSEVLSTFVAQAKEGYELEQAVLSITYPDGKTRSYSKLDLKTEKDSKGAVTYKLIYPEVQKGCVISEGYVLALKNAFSAPPLYHEVPLQFSIPCQKVSFRYLHPYWWKSQVKALGSKTDLPVEYKSDSYAKKTVMTYTATDVPAVENEAFSPFFKEVSNYAEIMITHLELPQVIYNSQRSWTEFGNDFRKYAIDKDPIFSRRVKNTAQEILGARKTPQEKLDAVVTWLQENMQVEYLKGNFADNLANKKGSSYQITGLAGSLLREAGINSRYLLIHAADDGFFDSTFISKEELYIPGLLVKLDGKDFVVFPYQKKLPITHIPERFQGQAALAIDASENTEIITIPSGNQSTNESLENYVVTLMEDGKVNVKEERVLQGSDAYSARRALADLNKQEQEKVLQKMLTYSEGKVTFNSYAVIDQEEYKKPLKIQLDYVIDNLVTLTPEEVIFNTGGLFSPASRLKNKVDPKTRQYPVRIYYDETMRKNITLKFPASWRLGSKLKDVNVENRFGSVRGSFKPGKATLESQSVVSLKKASEPKESFSDLLDLVGKKSSLSIPTLVFTIKP